MTKLKSGNKIIDLSEWQTPQQYADNHNLNRNTIRQYLYQNKHEGKNYPIDWIDIPELGLTLVRAKNSSK